MVVAAVEATCGVVAAGYLVVVGIDGNTGGQAGGTAVDRLAPFVLAAVVLALLLGMALRSYRRAGRHGPSATNPRSHPFGTNSGSDPAAIPTLPDEGRRELFTVIVLLADAGLFAPETPDPDDLEAAVADAGAVTVDTVLMALLEADYWRPGFRADRHLAALAFHDSQVEQDRATLRTQVDDLARLVGDRLAIRLERIEVRRVGTSERTEIDLTLDGRQHRLDYASHLKRLSTVLHVASPGRCGVCNRLRARRGRLTSRA